ncbi:MAG TPA: histidine--tRNA ligase [Verrucomicrobiae bacterium]|nr:histidine--tRNA ligase [Verrucomicrobiae bacterium]
MNPLPGFRDFYPEALAVRRYIFEKWRDAARRYGFREYDGPPLEPLELFTQKSGEEIVGQLFNFVDKGERAVALRPEMTPTLARMVGAHHRDYKKPIKWFAIPQLFRYEKQQRGRLREHFQFNADIIGEIEGNFAADAELVSLAIDTLRAFGLTKDDFVVRISDRRAWQRHLGFIGVTSEQRDLVLQAIDKFEREPIDKTREKLTAAGLSSTNIDKTLDVARGGTVAIATEVDTLLLRLGPLAEYCRVDFKIVRGLAYYTGIVWEIHVRQNTTDGQRWRAIAGGGRYDNLLKTVGGVDLPALGFGMGDVVLMELLKDRGLLPEVDWMLDCYIVIAEESVRPNAMALIGELRSDGFAVDYSFTEARVGKQFQMADALGARFALTIGPDESKSQKYKLKKMATSEEKVLDLASVKELLRKA